MKDHLLQIVRVELADLRPFVERQADLDLLSKEAIRKLLDRA